MINFINFTRVQPESIMEFLTGQKVNLQPMFKYFTEWILFYDLHLELLVDKADNPDAAEC